MPSPVKKTINLTLDFVSDSLNRKIHKIIKNSNFDIRLVSKPAKNMSQVLNKNEKARIKHSNCKICQKMPSNYTCLDRFLVYKFTCDLCSEFYIGQTNRPFFLRYKEHMRSVSKQDKKSALSQHSVEAHSQIEKIPFTLRILQQCHTPLETRLSEARAIDFYRPSLNRRHERTW